MIVMSTYEAKNRLSELLRLVAEAGETVIVTRRRLPVAAIVPIAKQEEKTEAQQ